MRRTIGLAGVLAAVTILGCGGSQPAPPTPPTSLAQSGTPAPAPSPAKPANEGSESSSSSSSSSSDSSTPPAPPPKPTEKPAEKPAKKPAPKPTEVAKAKPTVERDDDPWAEEEKAKSQQPGTVTGAIGSALKGLIPGGK